MGFMDKAKQAKDLYKMQKKAKAIKKELKNIHIEANVKEVIVIMNAEMETISVTIPENLHGDSKLGDYLKDAFNKAIKKAQLVAADKMKDVMGDFGFGG